MQRFAEQKLDANGFAGVTIDYQRYMTLMFNAVNAMDISGDAKNKPEEVSFSTPMTLDVIYDVDKLGLFGEANIEVGAPEKAPSKAK